MMTNSPLQLNIKMCTFPRERIWFSWISFSPGLEHSTNLVSEPSRLCFYLLWFCWPSALGEELRLCSQEGEARGSEDRWQQLLVSFLSPWPHWSCHTPEFPLLVSFIFLCTPPQKSNHALERILVGFQVWLRPSVLVSLGGAAGLVPAFGPGCDPGDPGLSPTSGCLHGACFSLCLCLCLTLSLSLSLCVSHE